MEVVALWRYPVKSLQGLAVEELTVGFDGVAGDRRWALLADGKPLSAKQVPELLGAAVHEDGDQVTIVMPDGTETSSRAPDVEAVLSRWLDREVELARHSRAPWVDDAPVHLLTTGSLDAMRAEHPGDWDPRRFRPNVLLDTVDAAAAWPGREAALGEVRLQVRMRTIRCAMTTHRQPDLPADREVLATLGRVADTALGVYAAVMQTGTVRVGDRLRLLDAPARG